MSAKRIFLEEQSWMLGVEALNKCQMRSGWDSCKGLEIPPLSGVLPLWAAATGHQFLPPWLSWMFTALRDELSVTSCSLTAQSQETILFCCKPSGILQEYTDSLLQWQVAFEPLFFPPKAMAHITSQLLDSFLLSPYCSLTNLLWAATINQLKLTFERKLGCLPHLS